MSGLVQRIKKTKQPSGPVLVCTKLGACILPVAQIAIGAVHLEDCPREHYIPIYLVVMGVFGLVLAVLSCLPCAKQSEDQSSNPNPLTRLCTAWNSLVSTFVFCWFIAGNVWIYRIYEPEYVKNGTNSETYCNKTVYLFAFWTTTLVYILLGLFLVGGCCVLFCFFLCGRADPDD